MRRRHASSEGEGLKFGMPRQRDFRKIARDVAALLKIGRDLRVLVILAEALAAADGPPAWQRVWN